MREYGTYGTKNEHEREDHNKSILFYVKYEYQWHHGRALQPAVVVVVGNVTKI
jgi:hypothetical protein